MSSSAAESSGDLRLALISKPVQLVRDQLAAVNVRVDTSVLKEVVVGSFFDHSSFVEYVDAIGVLDA